MKIFLQQLIRHVQKKMEPVKVRKGLLHSRLPRSSGNLGSSEGLVYERTEELTDRYALAVKNEAIYTGHLPRKYCVLLAFPTEAVPRLQVSTQVSIKSHLTK